MHDGTSLDRSPAYLFLVTGENKCSILKEILDKNKEGVYPASYIWHHARNPQLYASLVS